MNPNHENFKRLKLWETSPDPWFGKPWRGWYVGLGRTRNSGLLANSNFECFLTAVREASAGKTVNDSANAPRYESCDWSDTPAVYAVSEPHWACGWVEWIAIHESDDAALEKAEELMNGLENYPILDEEHHSNMEFEAEEAAWNSWVCADLIERLPNEWDEGELPEGFPPDYPTLREWAEDLDDGILYDAYRYAMEECNEYPIHEDSGVCIDIDAIAEEFEIYLRELREKEIDGPDAVKQTAFGFAGILTEEV